MKHLCLSLCVLFACNAAVAQMTDYPNSIGFYFDEGATTNFRAADVPICGISAYLILTHPTGETINSYRVVAYGMGMSGCEVELPGGGEHDGSEIGAEMIRLEVVFPEPLPTSTITVLASLHDITGMVDVESICLMLYTGSQTAVMDGSPTGLDIATGDEEYPTLVPVASINEGFCTLEDIVSVRAETMTSVKKLFR